MNLDLTLNEGDLVTYKTEIYWIAEVRNNKRLRLLPLEAVDFDEGVIYNLSKTIEVDQAKVKKYKADENS